MDCWELVQRPFTESARIFTHTYDTLFSDTFFLLIVTLYTFIWWKQLSFLEQGEGQVCVLLNTPNSSFLIILPSGYRNSITAGCFHRKFMAEAGWRLLRRQALADVTICDVIYLFMSWFINSCCGLEKIPYLWSLWNFRSIR